MSNVATTASSLIRINKVFYEPNALKYQRGRDLFQEYQEEGCEMVEVDSHWKIPEVNGNEDLLSQWNKIKSTYLILGEKKSIATRPNCRSTDFIAPSQSNGCAMSCAYCFVARRKGYANPITIFTNIEKIIKHLQRRDKKWGPKQITEENVQCDPKYWTYDIGENNDCSVDDLLSDNVQDLIKAFSRMEHSKCSFATKYVNRRLLQYDPKGRTRIRYSLMPADVARVVDVRTSPVAQRIQAINDFVEAGYECHINLSPVIVYDGWERDYRRLFQQIDDVLSNQSKQQLKAEVIFLTHNQDLHHLNLQWHPKAEEQYLWRHWENVPGDNKTPVRDKEYNKYSLPVIQQRKLSQNGMVNLRYKNNVKQAGISTIKNLMSEVMPYCQIRYIF